MLSQLSHAFLLLLYRLLGPSGHVGVEIEDCTDCGHDLLRQLAEFVHDEDGSSECVVPSESASAYTSKEQDEYQDEMSVVRENVAAINTKLKTTRDKSEIVKELIEFYLDKDFVKNLDGNAHLLGFNNGVFDLKAGMFREAIPEDNISFSVGYDYRHASDPELRAIVTDYFSKVHPDAVQRLYVLRMFARELYGVCCDELFHVHAGYKASAANGKSKFFKVLEYILGDYIHKFPVSVLTCKDREEANKPKPELDAWKGKRILYCTEPVDTEILHSGILKDLTGGERITYRLLYVNQITSFEPQYSMHIMCNGTPQYDGSCEGMKRRVRKIPYIAKFVAASEADPEKNMFPRDTSLFARIKEDDALKMEFMSYLLEHFDINYDFPMCETIKNETDEYQQENDPVKLFIVDHIGKGSCESFFTLQQAYDLFKQKQYSKGKKLAGFKSDLEKNLQVECEKQKWVCGKKYRSVFMGYNLLMGIDDNMIIDV